MGIGPETAVSPLAQAPPDRPTRDLEMVLNEAAAMIQRDGGIDQYEQRTLRGFMQQIALFAQQNQGFGRGPMNSSPEETAPPQSPMEMNAQSEDYGSGQGEPTGEEY